MVAIAIVMCFGLFATGARADTFGAVSGRVIDDRTGVAIETAAITVFALTDSTRTLLASTRARRDGSFNVIGLRDFDILLVVEARGFESRACPYRLSPGGDTRVTFELRKHLGPIVAPPCPVPPIGGGQTQDIYIVR